MQGADGEGDEGDEEMDDAAASDRSVLYGVATVSRMIKL